MCNIFGQLQFQLRQTEAAAEKAGRTKQFEFVGFGHFTIGHSYMFFVG